MQTPEPPCCEGLVRIEQDGEERDSIIDIFSPLNKSPLSREKDCQKCVAEGTDNYYEAPPIDPTTHTKKERKKKTKMNTQ